MRAQTRQPLDRDILKNWHNWPPDTQKVLVEPQPNEGTFH